MTASIAWKLNRVRCMSAAEIAHRIAKAATLQVERLGLLRMEVPAADLSRTPAPWIDRGTRVELVFGASGTLARQILDGAPFELFLAADEDFPNQLVKAGLTRDAGAV